MFHKVPILVCGSIREASCELLGRPDFDLYWTTSVEEALAVARRVDPAVVILGESAATELFQVDSSLPRRAPCVVVSAARANCESHMRAGAVAVVEPQQVAAMISELTGIPFRAHPRVPFRTRVGVEVGDEKLELSTLDLSQSGASIAGLPEGLCGERVVLTFHELSPVVKAEAVVVRSFSTGTGCASGLCFTAIEENAAQVLAKEIDRELEAMILLTEEMTIEMRDDTFDLMTALSSRSDGGLGDFFEMLSTMDGTWMPSWLRSIGNALTVSEKSSLRGRGPDWAYRSVLLKIEIERTMMGGASRVEPGTILQFCALLGVEVQGMGDHRVADAALIRGALLGGASKLARRASRARLNRELEVPVVPVSAALLG